MTAYNLCTVTNFKYKNFIQFNHWELQYPWNGNGFIVKILWIVIHLNNRFPPNIYIGACVFEVIHVMFKWYITFCIYKGPSESWPRNTTSCCCFGGSIPCKANYQSSQAAACWHCFSLHCHKILWKVYTICEYPYEAS